MQHQLPTVQFLHRAHVPQAQHNKVITTTNAPKREQEASNPSKSEKERTHKVTRPRGPRQRLTAEWTPAPTQRRQLLLQTLLRRLCGHRLQRCLPGRQQRPPAAERSRRRAAPAAARRLAAFRCHHCQHRCRLRQEQHGQPRQRQDQRLRRQRAPRVGGSRAARRA